MKHFFSRIFLYQAILQKKKYIYGHILYISIYVYIFIYIYIYAYIYIFMYFYMKNFLPEKMALAGLHRQII